MSLSANIELLTAIANDMAYEDVFTYQLQSQSEPGDVLIAISSSGRSPNIVRALTWARDHGLRTIALTGFDGGDARAVAEVSHPCRRHELRRHRGLAPSHHACPGPVHPPVADDRRRDLVERVLSHGSHPKPTCDAKAGRPLLAERNRQQRMRVAINLLTETPSTRRAPTGSGPG